MNDLLKDVTVPAVVEAIEGNLAAFLLYCNRVPGAMVHEKESELHSLYHHYLMHEQWATVLRYWNLLHLGRRSICSSVFENIVVYDRIFGNQLGR